MYVHVYEPHRHEIEIEETYLRRVMERIGVHTETEAIDLALRHLAGSR